MNTTQAFNSFSWVSMYDIIFVWASHLCDNAAHINTEQSVGITIGLYSMGIIFLICWFHPLWWAVLAALYCMYQPPLEMLSIIVKMTCLCVRTSVYPHILHLRVFTSPFRWTYALLSHPPLSLLEHLHRSSLPPTVNPSLIYPLCLMSVPVLMLCRKKARHLPHCECVHFQGLCFPLCSTVTIGDSEQWSRLKSGRAGVVCVVGLGGLVCVCLCVFTLWWWQLRGNWEV